MTERAGEGARATLRRRLIPRIENGGIPVSNPAMGPGAAQAGGVGGPSGCAVRRRRVSGQLVLWGGGPGAVRGRSMLITCAGRAALLPAAPVRADLQAQDSGASRRPRARRRVPQCRAGGSGWQPGGRGFGGGAVLGQSRCLCDPIARCGKSRRALAGRPGGRGGSSRSRTADHHHDPPARLGGEERAPGPAGRVRFVATAVWGRAVPAAGPRSEHVRAAPRCASAAAHPAARLGTVQWSEPPGHGATGSAAVLCRSR
jgi:hypothetical protein